MKGEAPKIIQTLYEAFDKLSAGKAVCISVAAEEGTNDVCIVGIMPDGKTYNLSFYEKEEGL